MHKGPPPWICACTNIDVRYLFNFRNVRNIHRCTLSGFVGSVQAWILNLNLDDLLYAHMSRMIHSNRTTIKVEVTELCLDNRLVIRNSCFAKKRTSDRFGRVVQSVWRRRQQMEVKFAEKKSTSGKRSTDLFRSSALQITFCYLGWSQSICEHIILRSLVTYWKTQSYFHEEQF